MADTYTAAAKAVKIEDQTRDGTWAAGVNRSLELIDDMASGTENINLGTSTSLTLDALANDTDANSRASYLSFTGTPASAVTITIPASVTNKRYLIKNGTGQTMTVKYSASTGVVLGNGDRAYVWADGSEVYDQGPGSRITPAEIAASVTPVNYAIDTTDYGEIRRYGYLADDSTDNSTALGSAMSVLAQATGLKMRLPPGIGRYSTSLNLPTHGNFCGAGKERSFLKYTGAAQAFKQATPSSRIYELYLSDFSLYNIGTGTVGLDIESVSTSNFERMWIDGFTTGVRIHSPTSGYAVYNRFYDVTTNNTGATTKGFVLSGTSTNANTFIACRANFASQTATFGWEITDGNGNQIIACHPEGGGTGVYITATGPGLSGGNVIAFSRFEGHALAINIASANVEHARIIQNHYTLNTADISDSGTRTVIDDPIASRNTCTFPSTVASHANGHLRYVRDAEGGASLPLAVFRDSASGGGTPVTVQAETERAAGSFFRGKRGGNIIFDVRADGMIFGNTLTVATLPAAASFTYWRGMVNDANATTFNSIVAGGGANVVPVYSDGAQWRIG